MRKADEERFTAFVEERMDRWRRSAFLLCRDWHTADAVENDAVRSLTCTKDGGCVSRKGPQGQAMTVRHWRFSAEADYTEVRIALPEKRVLILEAHNQVLTKDQLIDVVSDLAGQIK
ncbi:hypothetical protein [Cryptosporangium aurantiacum]|uniref:Uncharacterized protein n=1 Tax=Cryptosporangium aurantiacum TaxID=134849 RepID=A0A1M7P8J7_9ACTN|nr:hypothetical protein [Cryptosporangium aurantiacum]SHN12980.1 hypothetical protein SAMN05443668_10355 [Cryptosporangium aurantiacum]